MEQKIAVCLSTRFEKPLNKIRKYFKMANVEQYACVRRLGGGDDMHALALDSMSEDRRDATFVRYDLIEDMNEKRPNLPPQYAETPTAFFGQLLHIFVVRLPPAQELDREDPLLRHPSLYILAAIHRCEVDARNSMDMPSYKNMGRTEVVDMTTVQCLIARLKVGDRWVIMDRTGEIQQSVHVMDE
ncbi:hypothetical protein CC2G_015286 [Coprinopsis cinerea AmutBmut pab1-1]|nr:hypothetical protein CC2G_015286 [Coprinopsis cinerea AmutBmut pab1-1]